MALSMSDVFYNPERDGEWPNVERPCSPIAFIINGNVVFANGFCPDIGDNIFLKNPTYSSRIDTIDGENVEVVIATIGDSTTEMVLSEQFTALLLSEPLAVQIDRNTSRFVEVGWKYDDSGFYSFKLINGIETRVNGMNQAV